jgi:hypothetical protein
MRVCMCVCMCVCMSIYMCMCMYVGMLVGAYMEVGYVAERDSARGDAFIMPRIHLHLDHVHSEP